MTRIARPDMPQRPFFPTKPKRLKPGRRGRLVEAFGPVQAKLAKGGMAKAASKKKKK